MKLCSTLVTTLALALAAPVFAQDANQNQPPADQQAPASEPSSNPSDNPDTTDNQPAPAPRRNRHRRAPQAAAPAPSGIGDAPPSDNPAYNANTAKLTGNEPEVRAYQKSDRVRRYPATDHGHVAGDPSVIDHSGDQAPVPNPTQTTVVVPPSPAP